MKEDLKIDIGNNILIFKVNAFVDEKYLSLIRLSIIDQINKGVLVLDKSIEVIIVKKEGNKK